MIFVSFGGQSQSRPSLQFQSFQIQQINLLDGRSNLDPFRLSLTPLNVDIISIHSHQLDIFKTLDNPDRLLSITPLGRSGSSRSCPLTKTPQRVGIIPIPVLLLKTLSKGPETLHPFLSLTLLRGSKESQSFPLSHTPARVRRIPILKSSD
jgi:hypothetical protein